MNANDSVIVAIATAKGMRLAPLGRVTFTQVVSSRFESSSALARRQATLREERVDHE